MSESSNRFRKPRDGWSKDRAPRLLAGVAVADVWFYHSRGWMWRAACANRCVVSKVQIETKEVAQLEAEDAIESILNEALAELGPRNIDQSNLFEMLWGASPGASACPFDEFYALPATSRGNPDPVVHRSTFRKEGGIQ